MLRHSNHHFPRSSSSKYRKRVRYLQLEREGTDEGETHGCNRADKIRVRSAHLSNIGALGMRWRMTDRRNW